MPENIIWILVGLFCINRLVLWIIFFKKGYFGNYGKAVIIINHITALSLPLVPQPRLEVNIYLRIILGSIIFIFGMFIIKKANDEFNKTKTRADTVTTKLTKKGIYSMVRHPIYLGSNIYFVGWALAWDAIYCFYLILLVVFLNWLQAFLEEKFILEKKFGDEYIEYKKNVGMFLPKIVRRR